MTMNAKAKRFDVRDHVLHYWPKLSNALSYAQPCSSWKILHSAYWIQVRVRWSYGFVSHLMGESPSYIRYPGPGYFDLIQQKHAPRREGGLEKKSRVRAMYLGFF